MQPLIYQPPTDPWLDILFEDADMLVVNKPSGLLSVPGRDPAHRDSVVSRVRERHPGAEAVHRLDMDTSGVLVLALTKAAERHLKTQFQDRQTHKGYQALIWGCPEPSSGQVDLPLICDWPSRPKQMVSFELGKRALTHYKVTERLGDHSRVEMTPVTGRSHQLRVHMQALGCPILGDRFYAEGEALAAADRLMLHAHWLQILHPKTGEKLRLVAPLPF
ncbi:bifunctional tRNA pseudouridine(32) synthase/23S rRNA pseudouridine(746) synthase RluA [Gallaecimonas kandeliae]|uniref:bifunctional tRNA pseudouridine(32) synthase/23S rRNA pseudouridine(746) synthase RluA n=1 Tax=Gallaecimonas kandeliae TaxID=3029055 RepID=UPI00264771FA|nr:bifunctional tRNA pseudouridine(32) synthase/23S rRNA pseudouridine(746) synthase RluA [Gallaecimonas kandeliae]WKE64462.1 bifunctional tRNA pseudouridine(32) synthase/23S rRNA pseudouridine(746) synthase RluA [Gallaecimonas kandeliae]